jgi:hypothetical protein
MASRANEVALPLFAFNSIPGRVSTFMDRTAEDAERLRSINLRFGAEILRPSLPSGDSIALRSAIRIIFEAGKIARSHRIWAG